MLLVQGSSVWSLLLRVACLKSGTRKDVPEFLLTDKWPWSTLAQGLMGISCFGQKEPSPDMCACVDQMTCLQVRATFLNQDDVLHVPWQKLLVCTISWFILTYTFSKYLSQWKSNISTQKHTYSFAQYWACPRGKGSQASWANSYIQGNLDNGWNSLWKVMLISGGHINQDLCYHTVRENDWYLV